MSVKTYISVEIRTLSAELVEALKTGGGQILRLTPNSPKLVGMPKVNLSKTSRVASPLFGYTGPDQ